MKESDYESKIDWSNAKSNERKNLIKQSLDSFSGKTPQSKRKSYVNEYLQNSLTISSSPNKSSIMNPESPQKLFIGESK